MKQLSFFFTFLLLILSVDASAQNSTDIDFDNLSNVEVESLTDTQIQRIALGIEKRGLTIEQAMQAAVARGMRRSEAAKLSRRLNDIDSMEEDDTSSMESSRLRSYLPDTLSPPADAAGQKSQPNAGQADTLLTEEQRLRNKIFGLNFFNNEDLSFEPSLNIPTPVNYRLGAGDELLVDIFGASERSYQLEVSPDGSVLIPNIGPVYLSGRTIEEAEIKLRQKLGNIYAGLDQPNGSTYMQVSLGQIRSIKVTIIGEVTQPGTYTLPSLASVFNALYAAGGPSVSGSFRAIDIIRNDSSVATFDLYDLLINSKQSQNIRLRDSDIIKINPYLNRVEVDGQVKRPGIYETEDQEKLADVIDFAGGFKGDAYTNRIKVIGTNDREQRIADIQKEKFDEYNLRDGDEVTVGKVLDRFENIVEINGAVYRGGQFELTDSTSVNSLIERAEGLTDDAFMNRGLIYRQQPDLTVEAIAFSVTDIVNNPEESDIALKENDIVRIQSIFDLREDFTVRIVGPVQNPQRFPFVDGMTLEDIIFQAGGFEQSAAPYRIEVARRVRSVDQESNEKSNQIARIFQFNVDESLKLGEEDADFTLQPFDNVYVRQLPNYSSQKDIKVIGEVQYPGTYSLQYKTERISDVIKRAGGLTGEAYEQGATLFRKREFLQQEAQQQAANVEGLSDEEQQEQLRSSQTSKIGIELDQVLNMPGSKYDLALEEGDSLFVPTLLQTVTVTGGVFYPTSVRFENDKGYEEYITASGGFTDLAKENRSYVIYANGEVDRVKKFLFFKNYPDVRPGATLVVPERAEQRKLTPTERVNIFSAIISTAALITTTIVQISR
jgi:protein involved in polysaccharide export with SLBB domain